MSDAWLPARARGSARPPAPASARAAPREPERMLVEFVSANPTGPMHVGHARNAAYGDALARMLAFHGHSVAREFYINDAGSQIVQVRRVDRGARARGAVPEDGYHGDYVGDARRRAAGRRHAAGRRGGPRGAWR